MDHDNRSREEILKAAKKKQARGPMSNPNLAAHRKRRSHSRGNSISHIKEIVPTTNSEGTDAPSSVAITVTAPSPNARPGSHHRRRSSMSTRRETAEMMGVSVPEPPVSESDKDDIRRLALWTLEGKSPSPLSTNFGFSKVEIPDWKTPDVEKQFSFPPGPATPFGITPSLAGKRDSFGKLLTSSATSSKVELGTLVEEDEDEDHEGGAPPPIPAPPPTPVRHRPATLNLRPLSLTIPLPTPSPTPPFRANGRLRELTLANTQLTPTPTATRRQSPPSLTPTEPKLSPQRQSTILYISSPADVTTATTATTAITPTRSASLPPTPSASEHRRSLSPSEQESLFQSQSNASLLARIADLEAKLASSDASRAEAPPAPSEELLNMVAELKAERDELNRDVAGWRTRTGDMEKQIALLLQRIETERRDLWVAKEQIGALSAEKATAQSELRAMEAKYAAEKAKREQLEADLDAQKAKSEELERELQEVLRTPTANGIRRIKSVQSVDSQATEVEEITFESFAGSTTKLLRVKAKGLGSGVGAEFGVKPMDVLEEEEEVHDDVPEDVDEEEEDPLAHYEDEGSEASFHSSHHSLDSSFSFPRPHSPLPISAPMSAVGHDSGDEPMPPPPPPALQPKNTHARRSSMAKDWTFPRGVVTNNDKPKVEVDKFFTCLDDVTAKDIEQPPTDSAFAPEGSHLGFGFGFGFGATDDDDEFGMPPFVLPAQETPSPVLDVVMEEDEEDEEEAFTFPVRSQTPPPVASPQLPKTPPSRPALTITTNADPLVGLSPPARSAGSSRLTASNQNRTPKPEAEQLKSFAFPFKPAGAGAPAQSSTSRRSGESENTPIGMNHTHTRSGSTSISRIAAKPSSASPVASSSSYRFPLKPSTDAPEGASKLHPPPPPPATVKAKAKVPPVLFMPQPTRAQTSLSLPAVSDSRVTSLPTRLAAPTQPTVPLKDPSPAYIEHKPRSPAALDPSPVVESPLKIGFAALTSLLPISWSPRQKAPELHPVPAVPSQRLAQPKGFVSREKQLQRLRHETALTATARTHEHKTNKIGCDQCALCRGKPIVI